jgi:hypothetical protein
VGSNGRERWAWWSLSIRVLRSCQTYPDLPAIRQHKLLDRTSPSSTSSTSSSLPTRQSGVCRFRRKSELFVVF